MVSARKSSDCPRRRPLRTSAWLLAALLTLACSAGCDQATRHKVLSTIFDGVPSLPPVGDYCQDYAEQVIAARQKGEEESVMVAASRGSAHKPYEEKKCQDCHAFQSGSGLILPREELCLHCHKGFGQGAHVHGPVSVGDCQTCHLPHNSPNKALLIVPDGELCGKCHQEPRLAAGMHEKVSAQQISCAQCHDPHAGDNRYFLK